MRIYLRALEPEDYIQISAWRQDDEISRLYGGNFFFVSAYRDKNWVIEKINDDRTNIYLAICLQEDDRMIGLTSINNIDLRNQKAEWGGTTIGDKTLWGKGYASEAAKLMLSVLFDQYPIHKCIGYCLEEHTVTIRMMNSLGFTRDGILRDDVYKNGEFKTKFMYSILRSEFEAIRASWGVDTK